MEKSGHQKKGSSHFWRGNRGRGSSNSKRTRKEDDENKREKRQKTIQEFAIASPYKGWSLYFSDEIYNEESEKAKNVVKCVAYITRSKILQRKIDIKRDGYFIIQVKDLFSDEEMKRVWPSLQVDIHNSPQVVLSVFGLAVHHILTEEAETPEQTQPQPDVPYLFARVIGFEKLLPLEKINANSYGKLVSVKGTVVRASNISPMCTKMTFKCCTCFSTQVMSLPDGKYTLPLKCCDDECRGHSFTPEMNSNLNETVDWQTIKLQEILTDHKDSGRMPWTIECELTNDLVDSCIPGDVVIVTGIVKITDDSQGGRRNKEQRCTHVLYIVANSVTNCKGSKRHLVTNVGQEFSMRDLYAVQAIEAEKDLFRLIVASLCPAIFGHEIVKAGLILALFGGSAKFTEDKNRIKVRGDPHILVVGDPGLGKSQLLQACASVAPRSVYVGGHTTTNSGLTVTVCKGSSTADYALEAGALVLADQGCCCIDEFDKMSAQHEALLEAMEQQSISIAKAGIICSLPARTSILAAANPVGGHYNKAKTVCENIKLGSALLSRFDLAFILLDKPDLDMDRLLSKHIIAKHSGQGPMSQVVGANTQLSPCQENETHSSLLNKLRVSIGEKLDLIPHQLLRKYIGYARTYVHCQVSTEAAKVLQEFYLHLREKSKYVETTPITTRQLESLTRLAEARAKVELREIVTEEDAKDVVAIMKCSMIETCSDEEAVLDMESVASGSASNGRSRAKKFIAALDKIAKQISKNEFTMDELKQLAVKLKMDTRNFYDVIDTLNNQNYLLKKGSGRYKLQTA